jgi:hypothetical protein
VDNSKLKNHEMPIRVYKPSRTLQLALGVATALFYAISASLVLDFKEEFNWLLIFTILFFAVSIWVLIISMSQKHLAIFENGLEYRIGSNRFFSRWQDLQCFESRNIGRSTFGISSNAIERLQEGTRLENLVMLYAYPNDFIPLDILDAADTDTLAKTDFGRELAHYAPQLFENGNEKQKHG